MDKKSAKIRDYAEVQYKDTKNLKERMNLWDFGNHPQKLTEWIFNNFQFNSNSRILDLGAGTGRIWIENVKKIPNNCEIYLTDSSDGMINSLNSNPFFQNKKFNIKQVDAQEISFPDAYFDTVIACHMLYHVPNLTKTMNEIKRILKPNGRFYATTIYNDHTSELFSLFDQFNLDKSRENDIFSDFWMESGIRLVSKHFSKIKHHAYENIVKIEKQNKHILIDYIKSMLPAEYYPNFNEKKQKELENAIDNNIKKFGYFQVSGKSGIIIGSKKENFID